LIESTFAAIRQDKFLKAFYNKTACHPLFIVDDDEDFNAKMKRLTAELS
jgi:hypothetical protein